MAKFFLKYRLKRLALKITLRAVRTSIERLRVLNAA